MNRISIDQALEAYNILKDYCTGQENCNNCLLTVSEGLYPEYCLMQYSEIPEEWQTLEV